jgi:hypothetical protein
MEPRRQRAETLQHEIGNMLTIARANLEGMLDGIVEPTVDRLEGIRSALVTASEHLIELAALAKGE